MSAPPANTIEGHDAIVDRFQRSLASGRLGSTFLFVGPEGVGKRTFARFLAQSLLCETTAADELSACGDCAACSQVFANTHPDFQIVSKPDDKSVIPLDLLIGDKQHRMRDGLCAKIAMKPARGGRKIAIIDDADYLNQEGANCLLKTLEEPPTGSVLILIGTSPQRQLPTIRSRCQIVRFQPLDTELCSRLLMEQSIVDDPNQAAQLARLSGGSLAKSIEMNDPDLLDFRNGLLDMLANPKWDSADVSKTVTKFVEEAGKEAAKRRVRLRTVAEFATDLYRQAMRIAAGTPAEVDSRLNAAATSVAGTMDRERSADAAERCLIAIRHIAANSNLATNVDAWIDDLKQIQRGQRSPWLS